MSGGCDGEERGAVMYARASYRRDKKAWYVFVQDDSYITEENPTGRKTYSYGDDEQGAEDCARQVRDAQKLGKMAKDLPALAALIKMQTPEPEKAPVKTLLEFVGPIYKNDKMHRFEWLETNTQIKRSTKRHYGTQLRNQILPYLGALPMDKIDRDRVKSWLKTDLAQRSEQTATMALSVLGVALDAAFDQKLIALHPARELSDYTKRVNVVKREVRACSGDELQQFLQAIRDGRFYTRKDTETVYMLFKLLSVAGLRIGEGVSLYREDILWDRMWIAVRRTLPESDVLDTLDDNAPKTGKLRYVDLKADFAPTLQAYMNATMAEPGALLFRNPDGGIMWPNMMRSDVVVPVRQALGLNWITPHTMRHTYASDILSTGGMDKLYYVQTQLGHANPEMTLKKYGHFIRRTEGRPVDELPGSVQLAQPGACNPKFNKNEGKLPSHATQVQPEQPSRVVTGKFGRKTG